MFSRAYLRFCEVVVIIVTKRPSVCLKRGFHRRWDGKGELPSSPTLDAQEALLPDVWNFYFDKFADLCVAILVDCLRFKRAKNRRPSKNLASASTLFYVFPSERDLRRERCAVFDPFTWDRDAMPIIDRPPITPSMRWTSLAMWAILFVNPNEFGEIGHHAKIFVQNTKSAIYRGALPWLIFIVL